MKSHFAASVLALLLPLTGFAADDGELWEVATQMNIPGMPAGMGGTSQRVCTGKDPKEDAARRPDMQKCKVTDMKQTATRLTLTLTCPDGTMIVDQVYNAARTEYKGTMTMKSRDGDMVMNTTGRKVGTCDVQQAKKGREEKFAKMKGEADAQAAAGKKMQAEQVKSMTASITKTCETGLQAMDARGFPTAAGLKDMSPEMRAGCDTRRAEFCKRFQSEAGFSRAASVPNNLPPAGTLCAVQPDKVQASLCGSALKNESLDFLSRHCPAQVKQAGNKFCAKAQQTEAWHYLAKQCPAESKALFAKNCAGRQFTRLPDLKMRAMCTAIARPDSAGEDRGTTTAPAPEPKKPTAAQQVEKGFGKGLDSIKGLFGR